MARKKPIDEEQLEKDREELGRLILENLENGPVCGTPWLNEEEERERQKREGKD